jgi:hypothetical protein
VSSLTPTEIFWATAFLSILLIRLLADYVKLRLHVRGIHIHHFIWGIVSAFIAIAVLYHGNHQLIQFGMFCAGLAASLIASEVKELVLQKWGR